MNGIATYKWIMSDRLSHCRVCSQCSGQIKTLAEWSLVVTPPVHGHCGCSLQINDWTELPEPAGPPPVGIWVDTPEPPGLDGRINKRTPPKDTPAPKPPPWTPPDAWSDDKWGKRDNGKDEDKSEDKSEDKTGSRWEFE